MKDLTVVILTKNEQDNIAKCVHSFNGIAKRFVIVDSYSTDITKSVCEELNNELNAQGSVLDFYEHEWENYAAQLNWGIENTDIDTEWVMRMDADEELLPELVEEISQKLSSIQKPVNGIILRRRVYFLGRWIKHGGRYPEYLLRIFRRGIGHCEMRKMDEHLYLDEGETVTFKYDLKDNNVKSLEWWTGKHNWYSNREAQDYFETIEKMQNESLSAENHSSSKQATAKRKIKNGGYYKLPKFWRAHVYFLYRYYIRLGFLDGPEGRIFHFLQAYWYRFLVDAKIYEVEKTGNKIEEQGSLK